MELRSCGQLDSTAQGIEDGDENVYDRQHNASFPYKASLRLKSILRVLAARLISTNRKNASCGVGQKSEQDYREGRGGSI